MTKIPPGDGLPSVPVPSALSSPGRTGAATPLEFAMTKTRVRSRRLPLVLALATAASAAHGATITHHHAVGRDHMPWLEREHGRLGAELLRALKERCDPAGIMNPGVLAERF